ncbi:2-isopropylmalate synthase [Thermoleptolyngbya sichuanensis XZ-Cy5]|uniref:2-isopropylmalate synthase n=1 Tax=Thermoleptolyngbya sichuanensis TaxID=2885951 RepID=UPI00240E5615|nr:2-isopropylmalate synthase [Thermoleptolyngbya sichuanensis]MDG2618032.1 2-isopropylmalate synthase [Thermoleptolyngbya sichuanensis XZ-Cy5]
METIHLIIADETLRDGEQQVGVCFSKDIKRRLAHEIASTGVHSLALMPAVHPVEEQLAKTLVTDGLGGQLAASTMMGKACIRQSQTTGVQHIILFHAVSDRLLLLRDPEMQVAEGGQAREAALLNGIKATPAQVQMVRANMCRRVRQHLEYAAQLGLRISFAAEDASRADFDFLVECINQFSPYLEQFLLCDTVGCLTPEKSYIWIHDLLASARCAPLIVHFHNDMGLALENTIQAVRAGAAGISGTFGGIGERAGNVAIEQVLNGLRLRFGWEVAGIDYEAIARVGQHLDQLGARAYPPYSQAAQRHEAGIHVHSLMRDRLSYAIFPYGQPEIWFGKHSGVSNIRYLFEHCLQKPLDREKYEQICQDIKNLSIQQNRSFSTDEILQWLQEQSYDSA